MSSRRFAAFIWIWLQFAVGLEIAEAQGHRFKLGGGAGFATLQNPDVDHGRTFDVGGFIGFRFNDNVSLEAGFHFARSNRAFDELNEPIEQTGRLPDFRFEANRYHADGTFVLNLGRRQPFHPFLLAGGGIVRRDEKRSDINFELDPDTGQILSSSEEVVSNTTEYEPTVHFGAGFELYFMYNLAARAEFRFWIPTTTEKRTRQFYFAATYYF